MILYGLAESLYGISVVEAHAKGICIRCKKPVTYYSPAGAKEYQLSGLCELCFDRITGEEDEYVTQDQLELRQTEENMELEEYTGTVKKDHAEFAKQWLIDNNYDADYEVVVAKDNELQIDYDRTTMPGQFSTVLGILAQSLVPVGTASVCPPYEIVLSKSGNLHVTITLPNSMPLATRVAWQASFGSDPKREALHLLSIKRHDKNPILLYQPKKTLALAGAPEPLLLTDGGTDGHAE